MSWNATGGRLDKNSHRHFWGALGRRFAAWTGEIYLGQALLPSQAVHAPAIEQYIILTRQLRSILRSKKSRYEPSEHNRLRIYLLLIVEPRACSTTR